MRDEAFEGKGVFSQTEREREIFGLEFIFLLLMILRRLPDTVYTRIYTDLLLISISTSFLSVPRTPYSLSLSFVYLRSTCLSSR